MTGTNISFSPELGTEGFFVIKKWMEWLWGKFLKKALPSTFPSNKPVIHQKANRGVQGTFKLLHLRQIPHEQLTTWKKQN